MLSRVPRDVWIGLAALVVAALYWWGADGIPISPLDGAVNAAAMPKALAYALGGLAAVLILRAIAIRLMTRRAIQQAAPEPAEVAREDEQSESPPSRVKHLRAMGMLAIGLVYLLIVPYLGYLVSVALLVFAVSLYMKAPLGRKTLAVAVGSGVFFYFMFVQFLDIPLPPGFWPSVF